MVIRCVHCGKDSVADGEIADGQHVRCPFCGEKSIYRKPTRIALPTGAAAGKRTDRHSQDEVAKVPDDQPKKPTQRARPSLRVIRQETTESPGENTGGQRRLHIAEEHVRFYEEMKDRDQRRKFMGNLGSILLLVALVGVSIGAYVFIQYNREKTHRAELAFAAEKARLEAERAEQERRERMKREAEQKAARERLLAEESARKEKAKAEQEKEARELLEAKTHYRKAVSLFQNGAFGFIRTMPESERPGKCDGEYYFLIPFLESGEVVVCTSTTNGIAAVCRLNDAGVRTPVDSAGFLPSLEGKDYIVATGDRVYFHSKRKKPHVGQIGKSEVVDLAKEFFGDLHQEVRKIDMDPDELRFEIVFIPRNSKKIIIAETVEYGAAYSLDRVRDAVEDAYPMKTSASVVRSRQKPYKRTTVFWDGAHIKKGVDGVTYVPRVAPPLDPDYGNVVVRGPGWDYSRADRSYYKARRRAAYTREQWQALHDEVLRQEEAERQYYERLSAERSGMEQKRITDAEKAYAAKIDKILAEGTLYFRAKVGDGPKQVQ